MLLSVTKSRITKDELAQLDIALAMKGLSRAMLAREAGIAYGTLRNILCGHNLSRPGRTAINAVLGRPILSVPPKQTKPPRAGRPDMAAQDGNQDGHSQLTQGTDTSPKI